jgi:adenosylcobinamide kinase/adenosylcobinamide-phosphate guanylyltransferase
MKELVIGGIRSGKSAYAEHRAAQSKIPVIYIATAIAGDGEMARRIETHSARRPDSWTVVEEPVHLAGALRAHAAPGRCLIVDCLTLWLTNLLCAGNHFDPPEKQFSINYDLLKEERDNLLETLPSLPGTIVLVSSEVGMGIVPIGELSRAFCDEAGLLNQAVGAICDQVTFVVAGLPHFLKQPRN